MDFGGKLHQFYHSSGLNWATYARCQEMSCVTRASACHHTLNDKHWHRLLEIPAIFGVKSNITIFNYVCRFFVNIITLERPWGGCPPGIQVAADRAPRSGWVTPERPPVVLPWFNDLANGQWKNIFFQTDANHKTNIRTEFFNSKQINRVVERPNSTESKLNYRFYV